MKPAAAQESEDGAAPEAKKLFFTEQKNIRAKEDRNNPRFSAGQQLEIQPIQDTVNERDISYRNLKKAEISKTHPAAPPAPEDKTARTVSVEVPPLVKKYQPVMLGLIITLVAFMAAYLLLAPGLPGFMLKRAAAGYLEKLSNGRYREAYDLLSTNSKVVCSAEEYVKRSKEYYAQSPRWEFKDIEVFSIGKTGAMVKYQLCENGTACQPDYISFVRENGKWARPYIWTLFEPIDSALARQDYPLALFLAQKLYLTDPIDPRASGYLCVSEFFMKIYDKSEESCGETLATAKTYPVGFSPAEIFWYRFYYAESLRFLDKLEPAIKEYDALLDDTRLLPKEQCPIYISRADAFVRLKKYENALDDAMKAGMVCEGEGNKKETAVRLRFLNGDAKPEAIAFAQHLRLSPNQTSIIESRWRALSALTAKLGHQKAKFLPKDSWLAAHISGPEYRVVLREESLKPGTKTKEIRDIMVFNVNLWTASAKIEKSRQPVPGSDEQK